MEEQIERFLCQLNGDKGFSPNTISAYRNDLGQFTRFATGVLGVKSWAELSESHLTSYVLHLRERQYARSTIARKVAAVKSFCHFLDSEDVLRANPAGNLASPKVGKFAPRAIKREEIDLLLAAPGRYRSPEALRDKAMLETLYSTGMRVSELTSLDLDDLDRENRILTCGTNPGRLRQAPLNSDALRSIDEYLKIGRPLLQSSAPSPALFLNHRGSRLTRQGFWLILKSYADTVGIGDITPHTIRHSFAVHELARGRDIKDIQRIMGHMSLATTQAYQQIVSLDGVCPESGLHASSKEELLEAVTTASSRAPSR